MIRTIIIDDEENVRSTTRQILTELRPDIEIIGEAFSVSSGIEMIEKSQFDLLLLDIKLPDGTGFDILQKLTKIDFKIIFITAFEEFAVRAFKFSAVDYILKPVSALDLIQAIDRVIHILQAEYALKLNTLLSNNNTHNNHEKRLVLKSVDKIQVVKINEIIQCESDQSYCHIYLVDGTKLTISKPLKEYDEILGDYGFFRIHKSHMVNLAHIRRFERSEGGSVIMVDDTKIPVSFRKRDELISVLEKF
jgi:two-component system, LytTR family, response regulator